MSSTGGPLAGAQLRAREGTGELMPVEVAATTFDDLFRTRYEPMVRVAFLPVGSRAEAEDVVQDAFARIELRWARLDNAEGYLHRCVVNRSYDVLRRRRLEQRFRLLHRDDTATVLVEHPDRQWSLVWRQTDGATVIASLSDVDRATVDDLVSGLEQISEDEWRDLEAAQPAPAPESTVPSP